MFILDSVSNYTPKDDRETQSICERITPRLAHANSAVVLSAVKVNLDSFILFMIPVVLDYGFGWIIANGKEVHHNIYPFHVFDNIHHNLPIKF